MEKTETDNLFEKNEKDIKYEKVISSFIVMAGLVVLMLILLLFYKKDETIEVTSTNSNDRFEIVYEQNLSTDQCIIKILVDRETDVEYLMAYDKVSHSMSVSLMRDKGGMVLLRE